MQKPRINFRMYSYARNEFCDHVVTLICTYYSLMIVHEETLIVFV